ncbi:MAG: right-handed parallel beta-helix repeat-containing protein [Lachnospiraceae bacterium]|nr:right-handed parallel beta-helix repeat-containing protein [Lachnospiraceae bacterium]
MNMRNFTWKRIAAGLLVVCMIINILPADFMRKLIKIDIVSAEIFDIDTSNITEYPISEGSIQKTINQIISEGDGKGKIVLDQDYTENPVIPDDAVIVIDLNGKTLSPDLTSASVSHIKVFGTLKIIDSTGEGMLCSDGTADLCAVSVINGGKLIFESGSIKDYYCSTNGAGIRVEDNGYLNFCGGEIKNCKSAHCGGGLFLYDASDADFVAGEITQCTAECGGGISVYRSGDITKEARLKLNKMTVTGNSADTYGGGIAFENAIYLDIREDTVIDDNHTSGNGGGIYFGNFADLELNGGDISENTAEYGGAVYFYAASYVQGSAFTMNNGKINNNSSSANGGALYFRNALSKTRTSAIFDNGELKGNDAGGNGGAVAMYYNSDITIVNANIDGNSAYNYGGAIYIEGQNAVASSYSQTLTMQGGSVSDNYLTSPAGQVKQGAGIYASFHTQINISGGEICRNTKAGTGAGMRVLNYSDVTISGGKFSENALYAPSGTGSGGALSMDSGKLVISGGEFSDNTCETGASNGGAIYKTSSTVEITGGSFTGNIAKGSGGAMVFNNASAVISGNTVIRDNYVTADGGGISTNYLLEISGNAIIENNTAKSLGGGIRSTANVQNETGASLEIKENAVIRGNTGASGGGIYGGINYNDSVYRIFVLKMKGGRIEDNTASTGQGGGVYIRTNANQYLTGGSISGNTAATSGGGILITRNQRNADGVPVSPVTVEVSTDMEIAGNKALTSVGGGAYLENMVRLELYDGGRIINNTAATYGGGVYVSASSCHSYTNARTGEEETEALEVYGGILRDNSAISGGRDISVYAAANPGAYLKPYVKMIKASGMENADASAHWIDELNKTDITDDIDIKEAVDATTANTYFGYTYNENHSETARIGSNMYPSIQSAVDAIESGEAPGSDIELLRTTREDINIPENVTASLDLCGNTIYGESKSIITVNTDAVFTLKDSEKSGRLTDGKGVNLYNNGSIYGGAILVLENGTLKVENVTFSGNYGGFGTAIASVKGNVEMTGGKIENNTYGSDNRMIYCVDGSLKMDGTIITHNGARSIQLSGVKDALIKNCEFSDNYGSCACALYATETSIVEMEGCIIKDNVATIGNYWGMISLSNVSNSVSVKDTIITGNISAGAAGVYFQNGTMSFENCTITDNTARTANAAGIYIPYGSRNLYLKDTKIYNNHSATEGCDLVIVGTNVLFESQSTEYDSRAVENWGVDGYDCWLDEKAGCYYVDDKTQYEYDDEILNITETVNSNLRTTRTLYLKAAKLPDNANPAAEIVDTGVTYSSLYEAIIAASKREGQVEIRLLKDITENVNIGAGSAKIVLDLNGYTITAPRLAACIIYVAGGDMTIRDSVGGGRLTPPDKDSNDISMTRAILIAGGKFTLEGGEISGFEYTGNGAAIYRNNYSTYNGVKYHSELYIKGGIIKNNKATANGGAVYVTNGSASYDILEISGGIFSGNSANNGGAIYLHGGSNNTSGHSGFLISGGTIENNVARDYGGGIYYTQYATALATDEVKIYGCEVKNNSAYQGGGLYATNVANNSYPFILGSEDVKTIFSGNSSTDQHSAAYVTNNYESANHYGIEASNIEVKDNTALSSRTMLLSGYYVTVKDCHVYDNYAQTGAAGLCFGAHKGSIADCQFHDNSSPQGSGGGLFITAASGTGEGSVIENCQIYGNTAAVAGGVYDLCIFDSYYRNCEIYDNRAVANGGGILFSGGSTEERTKTIDNCRIENNYSGNYGGGIAGYGYNDVYNLRLVVKDTTVKKNTGAVRGGGLYFHKCGNYKNYPITVVIEDGTEIAENDSPSGSGINVYYCTLEVNGGTIHNNTTTGGGGGIRFEGNTVNTAFKMTGGIISDNQANTGGGIYYYTEKCTDIVSFYLTGGKIINNTAANGGGMYMLCQNVDTSDIQNPITGVEIAGNTATNSGGGIYVGNWQDNVSLDGDAVIRNNTAGNRGGGVYVAGARTSFTLNKGKMYGNTALFGNDAFIYYDGTYRNADLYLMKPAEMFTPEDEFQADAWIDEGTETEYKDILKIRPMSSSKGYTLQYVEKSETIKAVWNHTGYTSVQAAIDAVVATETKTGEIVMVSDCVESVTVPSGCNISLNLNGHMLKNAGKSAIVNRGTLVITDEKKNVTADGEEYEAPQSDGIITGSTAKAGGGIHILSGSVTLKSGKIADCSAGEANVNSSDYGGGGVAISGGEFILDGGTICENAAFRGSAVTLTGTSAVFKMYSGTINNNVSTRAETGTSRGLGAIFNNGGKVYVYGGRIADNIASEGAGIYNTNSGKVYITGIDVNSKPQIMNNTAGIRGGGMVNVTGTVIISNAVLTGNKTTKAMSTDKTTTDGLLTSAGGAIYVANGTVNIEDGTVVEKNSAVRGGGIYQHKGIVNISGSKTKITGNTAMMGGGCAQCPIPDSASVIMNLTDGASVYGNLSTLTSAGNDFYSAWEGTNTYAQQLGSNANYTPKLNLLPAGNMAVGESYNVWKNDSYSGTQRIGTDLVSGQYITADVIQGNNLQLTAAYYNTDMNVNISNQYKVTELSIKTMTDGTGYFDDGQTVSGVNMDDSSSYEQTAAELLETPGSGAEESAETYLYNGKEYHFIEYNGILYERNQAVTWQAGNDSNASNGIVRSFDKVTYDILSNYVSTLPTGSEFDPDGYDCRLKIRAVLPCSMEDAAFDTPSNHGILNAKIIPGTDDSGNPIQILTGYWEVHIAYEDAASGQIGKDIAVNVYGLKDGTLIKPTFECWFMDNDTDPHQSCDSETITVSAAPKYNITILNNEQLSHTGYFDTVNGVEVSETDKDNPGVVYGTILGYGITVELYNDPSVKNLKGIEIPKDGLEFDISFKGSLLDAEFHEVSGAVGKPVVWAYKENNTSTFGRKIGSNTDNMNMNWDDEDAAAKLSYYAYGAAPYNSGNNEYACYNGGSWTMTSAASGSDETKVHVSISDFVINENNLPTKYAGNIASNILNSYAVKAFSAGYIQTILPIVSYDEEAALGGYYKVNMESAVTGLNAEGLSGVNAKEIHTASNLNTEELIAQDINALNEYYGYDDPEQLKTNGIAVGERRYADNYIRIVQSLLIIPPGNGNSITKMNFFNNAGNNAINNRDVAKDNGRGDTPLNSTVYVEGNVNFGSETINTSDETSPYYIKNDPLYDSQYYNVIEYNYMTALNVLQKFDADVFTPVGSSAIIGKSSFTNKAGDPFIVTINESATQWSSNATTSYNLTILYAAKPDGTNWTKKELTDTSVTPNISYDDGGVEDMDRYREENLILFKTLDDLHAYLGEDAKCVAILYQFRNCCIRSYKSVRVCAKMDVTGDFDKVGKTYCTTNDTRAWLTYRPHFKIWYTEGTYKDKTYNFVWSNQIYEEKTDPVSEETVTAYGAGLPVGQDYQSLDYYTENDNYKVDLASYLDGYVKSRYRNGTILSDSHNGRYSGNSILLYSVDTSIALNVATKVKGSNAVQTNYKISEGEREVKYRITPSIKIESSANKTELVRNGTQSADITIKVTIPADLHYREGSVFIDYDYEYCDYEEGSLEWSYESIVNPDGTTTITLVSNISDIEKGLPEIYYDCTIGDESDPAKDIQTNGISLTSVAEISAKYSERNIIAAETHNDTATVTVSVTAQEGISKNIDSSLTELGEDFTFILNYGNNVVNMSKDIEIADVMPHNNDDRNTDFTGGYKVKTAVITFTSAEDYNEYKNNAGKLYFSDKNMQWSSEIAEDDDKLTNILEYAKEHPVDVTPVYNDTDYSISYDFAEYDIGTNAYDGGTVLMKAPVLYAYIPQITGKQRLNIKLTVTPKKCDGTEHADELIESVRDDNGNSITETQVGGNTYHNSFYYRKRNGDSYYQPLMSNEVSVSVIKRIISGTVWMDQDQDGLYNTEEFVTYNNSLEESDKKIIEYPIKGITAALYYVDNHGVPELGNPVKNALGIDVLPVKTDSNGEYSFENLLPGNYTVIFTDSENDYQYRNGDITDGMTDEEKQKLKHPIDFEKLSVTDYSHDKTVRGNKSREAYDDTDKAKLMQASLVRTISLPEKDKIPAVIYASPNWNLGLYYIDLSVEKTWKNMKPEIQDGMSVEFDITGRQEENTVYHAELALSKNDGNVAGQYKVAGKTPEVMDVSERQTDGDFIWTPDSICLQAENKDGNIEYSFNETAVKMNGVNVNEYFIRTTDKVIDEISKKYIFSAVNTQILGSLTIVKKTGGGDPLEGAGFSAYQVLTERDEHDTKFYSADEGVGTELVSAYQTKTSENCYKVILGTKSNLDSMNTDAVMFNAGTNELTIDDGTGSKRVCKVHKELYDGKSRYYFYTKDTVSFSYDWILGGIDEYNALRSEGVININDKIELNNVVYSVMRRKNAENVNEYYVEVTVSTDDSEKIAIVEFLNLPLFDKNGNRVYYTVRETKVPDKYISLADFNTLTGIDLFNDSPEGVHDYSFEVENTKQMQLPLTGGSGMSTMVILGTMFTVLAGAYLVWLMYMKKRERGIT